MRLALKRKENLAEGKLCPKWMRRTGHGNELTPKCYRAKTKRHARKKHAKASQKKNR